MRAIPTTLRTDLPRPEPSRKRDRAWHTPEQVGRVQAARASPQQLPGWPDSYSGRREPGRADLADQVCAHPMKLQSLREPYHPPWYDNTSYLWDGQAYIRLESQHPYRSTSKPNANSRAFRTSRIRWIERCAMNWPI